MTERFTTQGGKRLRRGFTTGTCAALAARAATYMLLKGRAAEDASLTTPGGMVVRVPVLEASLTGGEASCAVRKDAGDDPDATDGILVRATVRRAPGRDVLVDGGDGVGRVTLPGLDQPVGAAAINSVPRKMIEREVRAVCDELGHDGGIAVVIAIPGGREVAAGTFNPKLGIVGGLSVIGTTGIVEPMSARAAADALRVEMRVVRARGCDGIVLTPGNYGEAFLRARPDLGGRPHVKCGNFMGEALDSAKSLGFREVLIVGHAGKLVKLSGGVMDTHSRTADCRLELLALHAALAGADAGLVRRVLAAATVDDGLEMLGGLRDVVMEGLVARAQMYCERRVGGMPALGVVIFSNRFGLLGISGEAERLLSQWKGMDG